MARRPRSRAKSPAASKLDALDALARLVLVERVTGGATAEAGRAALELGKLLAGNLSLLGQLLERLGSHALLDKLLDLPTALSLAKETDLALSVASAIAFIAPDKLNGDRAVILAQAGQREEALSLIERNLSRAEDAVIAEAKAGDAYRALGEHDSAEAYYRRSLAEAKEPMERAEAVLRITSLLIDCGREADARAFVEQERAKRA